jgi:UDP-glucose pyrophosphorylase
LIEKPEPKDAPSNLGITGLYALTPEIFDAIDRIKPGKNGEYQLTDALKILAKSDEVFGARFEGKRYDIGTKELWIRTFFEFAKEDSKFNHILENL